MTVAHLPLPAQSNTLSLGEAIDQLVDPPIDPPPPDEGGPKKRLPRGCPVTPLGMMNGVFWYLSPLGELRELKARDHGNKDLVGLFAPESDFLETPDSGWTRGKLVTDKATGQEEYIVSGFHADKVAKSLMDAAAAIGVWSPRDKVRGRGAWADDDGGLILHCGADVLLHGGWQKPGAIGGHVYPTAPRLAKPAPPGDGVRDGGDEWAGRALMTLLRSWSWRRPSVDPMLMLGWIGCAPFGGALGWRPTLWVTGDKSTGKSTLQKMLAATLGDWLISTADATEAGIRQTLNQQTLPVAIDELEAEEDDRRAQAIIKLARIAASGAGGLRGGQDHVGHEFTIRSSFLFSSIRIPNLTSQDRSRIAVLDLGRLGGGRAPAMPAAELRAIGAVLRRRVADRWGRFARLRDEFADYLIAHGGHNARSADVYAGLVAMAHLLENDDDPDADELMLWSARLDLEGLVASDDDLSDAEQCLAHLATSHVTIAGHGTVNTVAWYVEDARREAEGMEPLGGSPQALLGKIGMRVWRKPFAARPGDPEGSLTNAPRAGALYVAVASRHQGLGRLFENSGWKGGGWSQALRRIEGAVGNWKGTRIGGMATAATLVPIEAMIAPDGEAAAAPGGVAAATERADA